MGASINTIELLKSYLRERKQYVFYKNTSPLFLCSSGVPQGSNLGPLLFLVFINDITIGVRNSIILLYADDIKLFRPIAQNSDCYLLEEDLHALVAWSGVWVNRSVYG